MAIRMHFSSKQPMDVEVAWSAGDSAAGSAGDSAAGSGGDSAAGSARIRFSTEKPGDVSFTLCPHKRPRMSAIAVESDSSEDGVVASTARYDDNGMPLPPSAAGSGNPSAAGSEHRWMRLPVDSEDAPVLRQDADPDYTWAPSTRYCSMKLPKFGSMWSGVAVVSNWHDAALDVFTDNLRVHFTLWAGPEFKNRVPVLRGFWMCKVAFGRWVGDGFRPFETVGRLKSLKVMAKADWNSQWYTSPDGGPNPRGQVSWLPEWREGESETETWGCAIAVKWEGEVAMFVSMEGHRVEAFYKGSDFGDIQSEEGKYLVCKVTTSFWEHNEPRLFASMGRLIAIEVLGQTEMILDWTDKGPAALTAEGSSGLTHTSADGSVVWTDLTGQ